MCFSTQRIPPRPVFPHWTAIELNGNGSRLCMHGYNFPQSTRIKEEGTGGAGGGEGGGEVVGRGKELHIF